MINKLTSFKIFGLNIDQSEEITHHCLLCSTNQGDITVYSVPQLKQQIKAKAMKKEDIRFVKDIIFDFF